MPSIPLSKILAGSKWNGKRACGDLQRPTMLFHLPPCHPWCQMSAHMKNGLADDSWLMGSIPGTKVMWVQQQRQIEGVKGEEKSHCQSRCCWNSIQSLQRACNAADTYFLYVYVMCSLTLAYQYMYVQTGKRCLPPFNIKNSLSTTWPESVKLRRLQRLNWFGPSRMSLGIGLGMANGWVRAHWISGLGHRMPHWLLDIINNQFYRFSTAYILWWNICL